MLISREKLSKKKGKCAIESSPEPDLMRRNEQRASLERDGDIWPFVCDTTASVSETISESRWPPDRLTHTQEIREEPPAKHSTEGGEGGGGGAHTPLRQVRTDYRFRCQEIMIYDLSANLGIVAAGFDFSSFIYFFIFLKVELKPQR